jgi:pimeloyl-[acyl-carrier protein] methyl ester esterase
MPTLETAPGVALRWEQQGTGRPIVLVHGWSMSAGAFGPQIRRLAAGHRVVAFDLRGHGASAAADGAGQRVEDHAADLAALFEHLDLSAALLVGWSLGGQIALEALPRIQGRLAGLALLSTTPCFTARDGWAHGLAEASVRALALRLDRRPQATLERFFDGMFVEGELAADQRARHRAAVTPAGLDAARAGLDGLLAADQRSRLAEVRVPTLLLHGERDPICLPAASAFAAERIAGAERCLLSGLGHAPHLSRPAEVNGRLERFAEALA